MRSACCVVSANVNGIRAAARRGGLDWLAAREADVYALQEVRATHEQLHEVLADSPLAGLHVVHGPASKLGHAGVTLLTRERPTAERFGFGVAEFDEQGRWIEVDVATAARNAHRRVRLRPHRRGRRPSARTRSTGSSTRSTRGSRELVGRRTRVVCGDLNVAHHEVDIKNWKGNRGKAGFLEAERAYFDRWFDGLGWVDVGPPLHGGDGPGPYTWWSWRGKAFDNDSGWRIDYQLASPVARRDGRARSTIGRADTYAERWSDHAAVSVTYDV